MSRDLVLLFFFFFNDPAPPEIYPLSLHDALPISSGAPGVQGVLLEHGEEPLGLRVQDCLRGRRRHGDRPEQRRELAVVPDGHHAAVALASSPAPDRKSTRLNSSHLVISYAVFCLK